MPDYLPVYADLCIDQLNRSLVPLHLGFGISQAALDKTDDDRTAMSSLLAYLTTNEVISHEQAKKGFDRLYEVCLRACCSCSHVSCRTTIHVIPECGHHQSEFRQPVRLHSVRRRVAIASSTKSLTHISLTHVQIVPDLILDTPTAPVLLEKFTEQAKSDGCLPADYVPPAPTPAVDQPSDVPADVNGHHNGTSST